MIPIPSLPEATRFWETRIKPYCDQLITGTYPLVPVQQHVTENETKIVQRYGQGYLIQPLNSVAEFNGEVNPGNAIACRIENGQPQIVVLIPALMAGLRILESRSPGNLALVNVIFESTLVIGLAHETDHLSNGWVGSGSDFDQRVDFERRAHAQTCEHVVEHFAARQKPVLGTTGALYRLWVTCGRNQDHPDWIAHIRHMYSKQQ